MNRNEKIGGIVLGTLLFAAMFYLLYDSFIANPSYYDDTYAADDLGVAADEEITEADEEAVEPAETPQ